MCIVHNMYLFICIFYICTIRYMNTDLPLFLYHSSRVCVYTFMLAQFLVLFSRLDAWYAFLLSRSLYCAYCRCIFFFSYLFLPLRAVVFVLFFIFPLSRILFCYDCPYAHCSVLYMFVFLGFLTFASCAVLLLFSSSPLAIMAHIKSVRACVLNLLNHSWLKWQWRPR